MQVNGYTKGLHWHSLVQSINGFRIFSFCIQSTAFQMAYSSPPNVPLSEGAGQFDPVAAKNACRQQIALTTLSGVAPEAALLQKDWPTAEEALKSTGAVDPYNLPLRDPEVFVAKQLGKNLHQWEPLLEGYEDSTASTIRTWLTEGASIEPFLQPFNGSFLMLQTDCNIITNRTYRHVQ